VIGAVEIAFREQAAGQVRALPRAMLPMAGGGIFLSMVASLPRRRTLGTKLVTWVPGNQARRLPTIHGSYLLTDTTTGVPLALMEAGFLTAIRTGAASALASRHLARPDARSVACFGAGVQAEFQLRCLQVVRPIDRVAVVGRSPARARDFAARMRRALRVPVTVTTDRRAAVRDADVIVCATTARTPVFRGRDLRPGAHVDAVGNFLPHAREVDTDGVKRARVVVDTYEGAWTEAGEVLIPVRAGAVPRRHVVAELAEVVSGRKAGRRSDREITLFKSVGWAAEDAATARLAYDRAMARNVGRRVRL
jgi:ornithine cyclodeaminase/alanine dehydrogenase-like protein (mu-crystallin family)